MKRYVVVACLLSVVCAAQTGPLGTAPVYDDFMGPFLDGSKWLTVPTCSATLFVDTTASINLLDCAREIESNKLRLMVRAYGNGLSDVGRQIGPSELYFVNPNAIHSITTTLMVPRAEVVVCPSNSAPFTTMSHTISGGNFFNPGTGNPRDDVAAITIVEHNPNTPPGILDVSALVFSPNAFYGFSALGLVRFHELLTTTVQWDQPNHQFIFHAIGPNLNSTSTITYSVPDSMPAAAPIKLLGARGFAPNCTTAQATADIEVLVSSVSVN